MIHIKKMLKNKTKQKNQYYCTLHSYGMQFMQNRN